MKNKTIAVLMGGWNSEREVSLRSGEAVYQELLTLGYKAVKIDFGRDIVEKLREAKPDVVFNALHGQYGEDGRVQGLLDILGIPYTHCGLLSSAVCMDKILTNKLCEASQITSPQFEVLHKNDVEGNKKLIEKIGKPFVIKPVNEGSSVGVEVILAEHEFDIEKYSWKYGDRLLVEKYIAGQEIQVAVLNGRALGAIEVRPKHLFYDYECKYTAGMTEYVMPAEISTEKYAEVLQIAQRCYEVASCSGVVRVDFILNNKNGGDNKFYLLEINTHPGFTATSLVPKIAKHAGISFGEIIEFLIRSAKCGI